MTIDKDAYREGFFSKLRFNRDLRLLLDTVLGVATEFIVGGDAYDKMGYKLSVKDPRVIKLVPYTHHWTTSWTESYEVGGRGFMGWESKTMYRTHTQNHKRDTNPVFGCSGRFVPLSMSLSLLRLFLWRRIFILMDKPLPAQGQPQPLTLWLF